MKDELNEVVSRSEFIVAHPDAVSALRRLGFTVEERPQLRPEQELARQAESRRLYAEKVLKKLPPRLNTAVVAIDELYHETRECVLFGHNGPAITLCGILVEYLLKHASFVVESGGYSDFDPIAWAKFENLDLAGAIARARRNKVITKPEVKKLSGFRSDVRNPYNHYNLQKIAKTANFVLKDLPRIDTSTGDVEYVNIIAADDPTFQGIAKREIDTAQVHTIFVFAHEVIQVVLERVHSKLGRHIEDSEQS